MKKLTFALSIACAGALAFADTEQWQGTWFSGIGSDVTAVTDLKATNGTWSDTITADTAEISEGALVLDLDSDVEATFTVTTAATDSKTAQKISITGVFTPLADSELPTASDMGTKGAQVGFAVVSSTETATASDDTAATTTTTVYKYMTWIGGDSWVELGTCADKDAATDLAITLAYWDDSVSATFAIKNGDTALTFGDENAATTTLALSDSALTVAKTNFKVASVSCTGSGTISSLVGDAQFAVATVGDRNYGTVNDAIAAASAAGATETTVKLVKDPEGAAEVPGGSTVKIDDNGKNAEITNNGTMDVAVNTGTTGSGEYTVPVKVTGGTTTYTPSDSSKEVVGTPTQSSDGKSVTVTVQTKADILKKVTFASKAVTSDTTIEKFRTFLTDNKIEAYTKANTSESDIQTALTANGGNTLPLWQSYALGIEPTVAVKATNVEAGKDTAETITLALPTIDPTGDYTVKIKVGDGTATEYTKDVTTLAVPTATGTYPIVLSFE